MEITETELLSHLSEEVITTAYCWKITLPNGNTIGLTDFDNDLKIENMLYHSSPGARLRLISCESHTSTAQTEVLVGTQITEADLRHGPFNSAQVKISLTNYAKTSLGLFTIFEGTVSEVEICNNKIIMQLVGTLCNVLVNKVGVLFSPQCRAQFCDAACKLNAERFTKFGHVSAVLEKYRTFRDSSLSAADCYYKHGIVRFLSGQNKQIAVEVRSNSLNTIYLGSRVPYPIRIGDRYSILAGCDKNFNTCVTKFKNTENFRGEPHVPDPHLIYHIVD
ncbi:MAG: DUF2163 domain-containing protein [Aaplasma endosymbiont of Hyalomma asiaticum]